MKNKLITIILILLFAAMAAGLGFFLLKEKKAYDTASKAAQKKADELNGSQNGISVITYNGKKYTENTSIKSYLFIGVDEREGDFVEEELAPGSAGQADCLMLLIVNDETKEANILQINRNAMTELDIYGELGSVEKTVNGQICLQYAYCTGGTRSCLAQKRTVEDLLFRISIDGYFAMSLPGIAEVNDALGGVDVTMSQDYTWINPVFVQGTTVHLKGELATQFVQYRDTNVFNSVEDRMNRQTAYMASLINMLKNIDENTLLSTLNDYVGNRILTDLKTNELRSLVSCHYNTDTILTLPGEMVQGEEYEEYNVDNTALQDMIVQRFYVETE